jgi:hypothetical protein
MAYLRHYYELNSAVEQTRMQQKAQSYQIVDNELYKISISCPSFVVLVKKKVNKYCRRSTQEYAEVISEPMP